MTGIQTDFTVTTLLVEWSCRASCFQKGRQLLGYLGLSQVLSQLISQIKKLGHKVSWKSSCTILLWNQNVECKQLAINMIKNRKTKWPTKVVFDKNIILVSPVAQLVEAGDRCSLRHWNPSCLQCTCMGKSKVCLKKVSARWLIYCTAVNGAKRYNTLAIKKQQHENFKLHFY